MAAYSTQQVEKAYAYCQRIVSDHYENFPVASLILPRKLRQPISAIYAFARRADDIADEGEVDTWSRLAALKGFDEKLDAIEQGQTINNPIFIALADSIRRYHLPVKLFHDLINAFRLDVTKTRYEDIGEVWDYCHFSANPVGRLLLHLVDEISPHNFERSDAICSALQLINFLQDISQDLEENNRIYLPADEMKALGVSEAQLREKRTDAAMRQLIKQQIEHASEKMEFGKSLGRDIKGRFGLQLRVMINGGLRVLELLEAQHDDCFSRPRLSKKDWARMLARSI